MSAPRSRKEENTYKRYRRTVTGDGCQFCEIDAKSDQLIKATKSFKIVRNIFAYSIWDGQRVEDHLMVVPNVHIDSLAHLPSTQAAELLGVIGEYEQQGYNVYARAPASAVKSVVHQHTHLIKTSGPVKTFIFLLRKPFYIRLVG